jgi:CheY-like chemotaxis protein
MQLLIVEDNPFNAHCLRRLLEGISRDYQITIVNHSVDALFKLAQQSYDCVILDGHLNDNRTNKACDGPELARILLQSYPAMPIIAWTDALEMSNEFAAVFKAYGKEKTGQFFWPKLPSTEQITADLQFIDYMPNKQSPSFAYQANQA